MWPAMMTIALRKSTRSAPSSRSAIQAPRIVDRYTAPPYAPTIESATPWSTPSPPSVTE